MTGALLIALYLVALACFLGLDIIAKVPPTLYALVLAGLGALGGVALVGGLGLSAASGGGAPVLAHLATAVGAAAAVGGTVALGRALAGRTPPSRKRAADTGPVTAAPGGAEPLRS